jgi:hypothetical protein
MVRDFCRWLYSGGMLPPRIGKKSKAGDQKLGRLAIYEAREHRGGRRFKT